jgi:four helix bundle protein
MPEFTFETLMTYQAARAFRKRIDKLARLLPSHEEYRLTLQMRKAGLSLTNCIAEGYGRYTYKDRIHFCRESRGSLLELVDDVNECADEGYAKPEHLETLRQDADDLLRLLNGCIRYLQKRAGLRKGNDGPATDK